MRFILRTPAQQTRGPLYMEQVLATLHQGFHGSQPICLSLLTTEKETTLAVDIDDGLSVLFRSQIFAAYPECQLAPVTPSALSAERVVWQAPLHLNADILPIKRHPEYEDDLNRMTADPLAALLLGLSEIAKLGLHPAFQLLIRPVSKRRLLRAERILRRAQRLAEILNAAWAEGYLRWACSHQVGLRIGARFLAFVLGRTAQIQHHERTTNRRHDREDQWSAAQDKLQRQLFEVNLIAQLRCPLHLRDQVRPALLGLQGALGIFQRFPAAHFRLGKPHRARHRKSRRFRPGFLLSAEELATLWHPPTQTVQAPTLDMVDWRELEPPRQLPSSQLANVAILGQTQFRGQRRRFGLLPDDRLRHLALLGKTGMGKTTLLQHLICSDLKQDHGLALIDPHGDLTEELLQKVPRHRTNDIVLFDAADATHPVAFNLLDCPRPEQKPLVVSGILAAFKKLFGEFWGPRLEYLFRNALLALIDYPGATLLSVQRFLIDGHYRRVVLAQVNDPVVRDFWEMEFVRMPPKLQAEAISPIQNKVGQFTLSPQLRNILGQSKSTLNLRQIMDRGQVLLVNLSKGRLGEDASSLLGALLISQIQLAAMSRADLPEAARRPFYLYVDEFQNFATDAFGTILSEARKYRLGLIVANQYLAQLREGTLHALFGNVGSLACFQCGAKDAELLAEQLGSEVTSQDLMRLPRFHAYLRLLIDGHPSRPFSIITIPPKRRCDPLRAAIIRQTSQRRYCRPTQDSRVA